MPKNTFVSDVMRKFVADVLMSKNYKETSVKRRIKQMKNESKRSDSKKRLYYGGSILTMEKDCRAEGA